MIRDHDLGLDSVDRQILAELQQDGRMTNVELARRVNLSAPPCLRRVRRLEEAGIIRGYHADVDPVSLGWEVTFFALVGLESQKQTVLDAFEALASSWPEVRECHMIRGGGDFLLRLVARDTAHENELTARLTNAPTVLKVETLQTSARANPGLIRAVFGRLLSQSAALNAGPAALNAKSVALIADWLRAAPDGVTAPDSRAAAATTTAWLSYSVHMAMLYDFAFPGQDGEAVTRELRRAALAALRPG
jgi:DNA-binding Lrp family transcriptional regulator